MKLTLKQTIRSVALTALVLAMLSPASAFAQLAGDNILGDSGVNTGTQAAPGFYIGTLYYRYRTDTIRKGDGTKLVIDPSQSGSATIPYAAPIFMYVSELKILGGNYGAMIGPGIVTGGTIEAPGFGFGRNTGSGMSDTYVAPFMLGWHLPRADFNTAFAFFAPTGRYTPGASDNTGRGMWAYETSVGTTVYLDPARAWTAATSAYLETHGKKSGTTVSLGDEFALGGVRVGNILTLEGGVARMFAQGAAHLGVAYYAQWKLTADDFGVPVTAPSGTTLSRDRVYGFGPDVAVPIAVKSTLIAFVNLRYFWETGAEAKTEGQSLVISVTFPVPSIKIPTGK